MKKEENLKKIKENEKLITNSVNPNFEHKFYKNYLDNLSNDIIFKNDLMKINIEEKTIIKNPEQISYDISIYDTYKLKKKKKKRLSLKKKNMKLQKDIIEDIEKIKVLRILENNFLK